MIDEEKIKELSELIKQPIKEIREEGQVTILEFENGQYLPLYGGQAGMKGLQQKVHNCSFCGSPGTKESPVVSLNKENDPVICSSCATTAIKLFVNNGIEIELDITDMVSEDLINKLVDSDK
ncbi:hypothetical protein D3C87_75980 [compost metagenome]